MDGTPLGDDQSELEPFLIDVSRFSYDVPEEDGLYELMGLDFSGRCAPSFVAGYFVMLSFERGQHTVHFSGANDSGFALESTYELTVR